MQLLKIRLGDFCKEKALYRFLSSYQIKPSGLLLQYITKLTSFEGLTIHRIVKHSKKLKNHAIKDLILRQQIMGLTKVSIAT
jgi:hypothetical protein